MAKARRVIGQDDRFGRFVVLSQAPRPAGKEKGKFWRCRCDCGREEILETRNLTRGRQACSECPSENSPYQSRWGAGWITAAMALAERMCERLARKGAQALVPFFWTKPGWKKQFVAQARFASELLKEHAFADIVRALSTPEGRRIHSLAAPWLPELIQRTPDIGEVEAPPEPPTPASPQQPPRPPMKTLLDKMRSLDE